MKEDKYVNEILEGSLKFIYADFSKDKCIFFIC